MSEQVRILEDFIRLLGEEKKALDVQNERLTVVASERWKELKAAEKLIRQLEKALKGVLYVAKTEKGGVPFHLRRDIREAEKVLEIVASVKRAKRS